MRDILLFIFFIGFIICQRMVELLIAKRNEKWMLNKGAIEFSGRHYYVIVAVHFLFIISFCLEKILWDRGLFSAWPVIFCLFIIAQLFRVWIIRSLGRCWNTKILVLPDYPIIRKGPYRFLKHPNYVIVSLEFLVIPLLFSAYFTTILFGVLNATLLAIRIPAEEKALKTLTEYEGVFNGCHRFIPKFVK
ncbi:hypothetical protein HPT25_24640 [Bacillus sp. BRMEA1]|uniref:isoprenylcysteine carboxyl methyltransferase family protein n=1 Tax=Neobacillus endophyticus TaxID=2738405 RepID=UPI001567B3D9|nr:isoprenylcysteine carboxylmethyltransferase family protein [Neobacillus endophyticus]NRD80515.1 hypothetical protein [Neobacillus endophyticus]